MEKKLKNLLDGLEYKVLGDGDITKCLDICINEVVYNTKNIALGDLFVCIKGSVFDAHSKIGEVIEKGARVIVVERDNENFKVWLQEHKIEKADDDGICRYIIIEVQNTKNALAIISKNFFGNPEKDMKVIGITGTKGKTTTAFMIKKILDNKELRNAKDGSYLCKESKVGIIGTIGVIYKDKLIETDNTTPISYDLQKYFYEMKEANVEYVVMEVSSQALKYNRVEGIHFDYVIWTNIEKEHIGPNEHTDYEDYLQSKLKIFDMADNAIVNEKSNSLIEIKNKITENNVKVVYKCENIDVKLPMVGVYNLENATLAYKLAKLIGIEDDVIFEALSYIVVPGRSEIVYKDEQMTIVVDFAHEQNGLKSFLQAMKQQNYKRIVVVFGCGGNRSKDRRYGMGEVAGEYADFVVLTADNSRYENVLDIISDIELTLGKYKEKDNLQDGYIVIPKRIDAIRYVIENHKDGDLICVVGKGHETSNEENGVKTHFQDREAILSIISDKNV